MQYAVLLGGVNLGGRTVKSDDLKQTFTKTGFENPQTVLASGNVIIQSEKTREELKLEIEALLKKDFQFEIRAYVIDFDSLQKVVDDYPFTVNDQVSHRYIIFRENTIEMDLSQVITDENTEQVLQKPGFIYWKVLKGLTLESNFAKYYNRLARKEFFTNRNINTLVKILAKKIK
ncbi:MAG: DUF1697 domain-containing protein [Saprospiraceae bacterium]|nr:DUF1697 domain-containing protein [Saprospiraceae bacterium]